LYNNTGFDDPKISARDPPVKKHYSRDQNFALVKKKTISNDNNFLWKSLLIHQNGIPKCRKCVEIQKKLV
jgi:hypothetical protein